MLTAEVIGNLGRDFEIKNIGGKEMVCLTVAHNAKTKDGEKTFWVEVLYYNTSQNLTQWLKKGRTVFASGRLTVGAYTAKDGHPAPSITLFADRIELLGGRQQEEQPQMKPVSPPSYSVRPSGAGGVDGGARPSASINGDLPF